MVTDSCRHVRFFRQQAALAGLNRRNDAIRTLEDALRTSTKHPMAGNGKYDSEQERAAEQERGSFLLALAKLLFQESRKLEAYELCCEVFKTFEAGLECFRTDHDASDVGKAANQTVDEAAEAYQLAGWIKIHSDDHSSAYAIWSRGFDAVPSCPFLARQAGKRLCWDEYYGSTGNTKDVQLQRDATAARDFIGGGAHSDGCFDRHCDLDAFAVPNDQNASARTHPCLDSFLPVPVASMQGVLEFVSVMCSIHWIACLQWHCLMWRHRITRLCFARASRCLLLLSAQRCCKRCDARVWDVFIPVVLSSYFSACGTAVCLCMFWV